MIAYVELQYPSHTYTVTVTSVQSLIACLMEGDDLPIIGRVSIKAGKTAYSLSRARAIKSYIDGWRSGADYNELHYLIGSPCLDGETI